MKINDIICDIDITSSYIPEAVYSIPILSLCHDSRHATPSCIFFCKKGAITDGHLFAYNAYTNGARIFIAEHALRLPDDAAVIITPSSSDALNRLAVKFYNDPAKELKIVGITGTKGKTTVAISAYKIAMACGMNVGYIGTNGIYYNGLEFETANTTPDALELQKALREMRSNGVTTVMLEVSSQALWQERTYGICFDTCVFTNLFTDHIGGCEHKTFEHYRDSKKRLFTEYKTNRIILNADSDYSTYMLEGSGCTSIIRTSANGDASCSFFASDIIKLKKNNIPGISFNLHSDLEKKSNKVKIYHNVFIPMPGLYNVENALLIISICHSLGLDINAVIRELRSLSIPGRFEIVSLKSKPRALFVIDYAHNGASLEAVIAALRDYEPKRIICLFGSVGDRTFARRGELGRVARDNADIIIITSDNPNNEAPLKIIKEIHAAIGKTDKPIYEIADRCEAVKKAYELANEGDFILLAGKGHETYQLIHGKRVPFSERNILEIADLDVWVLS